MREKCKMSVDHISFHFECTIYMETERICHRYFIGYFNDGNNIGNGILCIGNYVGREKLKIYLESI